MEYRLLRLIYVLLGFSILLPLFSFRHYAPLGDWYFTGLAIVVLGCCFLVNVFLGRRFCLSLAGLFTLLFVLCSLFSMNIATLNTVLVLLLLFMFYMSFGESFNGPSRIVLIDYLAIFFFIGGLLQAVLGFSQLLGIAPYLHGYVAFDVTDPTGNIMGNIGQRNLYAEFLAWGQMSACYLYAQRRLRGYFFLPSIFFLSMLIAWCGARLPLAYALGCCSIAWIWHRRNPEDARVAAMAKAVAWMVMSIGMTQTFGEQIDNLLRMLGLSIHTASGSTRLFDAGFGIRRRIEWTKAWMIFKEYPWTGVGLGGFAAKSVWLEAYGGLPKVPENWLFTQSHNLVFQLLAETGIFGTLAVVIGIIVCLWPYFRKGAQTPENMLLISLAMMILGHSMFEYPLWYWPYITLFILICVLSPLPMLKMDTRPLVVKVVSVVVASACFAYFASGQAAFWLLVRSVVPSAVVQENLDRLEKLNALSRNPLWHWDAELVMTNYLVPSPNQLNMKLERLERAAAVMPYSHILYKLAVARAMNHQPEKAKEALTLAIANFPEVAASFIASVPRNVGPELVPLITMAKNANKAFADPAHPTDEERTKAAMTVSTPVTRQPMF